MRIFDDKRHICAIVVKERALADKVVITHHVPVIGGEDYHGIVVYSLIAQSFDYLSELLIDK